MPKDRSSGRRPSLPATTESPLCTWSVGQKKNRSLGRCPGSLPLLETDPEDETRQQNKARNTRRDQTHTQNRKRRPEARAYHPRPEYRNHNHHCPRPANHHQRRHCVPRTSLLPGTSRQRVLPTGCGYFPPETLRGKHTSLIDTLLERSN